MFLAPFITGYEVSAGSAMEMLFWFPLPGRCAKYGCFCAYDAISSLEPLLVLQWWSGLPCTLKYFLSTVPTDEYFTHHASSSHSHRIRSESVKLRTGLPPYPQRPGIVLCCHRGGICIAKSGNMIWCCLGRTATMFRPSHFTL